METLLSPSHSLLVSSAQPFQKQEPFYWPPISQSSDNPYQSPHPSPVLQAVPGGKESGRSSSFPGENRANGTGTTALSAASLEFPRTGAGEDLRASEFLDSDVPGRGLSRSDIDGAALSLTELKQLIADYLEESEMRFLSPRTIEARRDFLRNLLWFLEKRGYEVCDTRELRQFFHYLLHGHEEAGGRFGHPQLNRPVRPITLKDYDVCLRAFFGWLKESGIIPQTPFAGIPKPRVRESLKAPLSTAQIAALLEAAGQSTAPQRNRAILSILLDTGCRASELIALRRSDLDLTNRCCMVLGKGNKYRTLYFGQATAQALREYLAVSQTPCSSDSAADTQEAERPLFLSERSRAGARTKPLTRSGLLQLLERLGEQCGLKASCSPHAFRRAFAVQTLRNGANVFSVQAMLGHTNLQMTQKYCAIALSDVEAQHRQFGPLDRMSSTLPGLSG